MKKNGMEKVKNLIIKEIYYLKENIYMEKSGMVQFIVKMKIYNFQ